MAIVIWTKKQIKNGRATFCFQPRIHTTSRHKYEIWNKNMRKKNLHGIISNSPITALTLTGSSASFTSAFLLALLPLPKSDLPRISSRVKTPRRRCLANFVGPLQWEWRRSRSVFSTKTPPPMLTCIPQKASVEQKSSSFPHSKEQLWRFNFNIWGKQFLATVSFFFFFQLLFETTTSISKQKLSFLRWWY